MENVCKEEVLAPEDNWNNWSCDATYLIIYCRWWIQQNTVPLKGITICMLMYGLYLVSNHIHIKVFYLNMHYPNQKQISKI